MAMVMSTIMNIGSTKAVVVSSHTILRRSNIGSSSATIATATRMMIQRQYISRVLSSVSSLSSSRSFSTKTKASMMSRRSLSLLVSSTSSRSFASAAATTATAAASSSIVNDDRFTNSRYGFVFAAAVAAGVAGFASSDTLKTSSAETATPSSVANDDFDDMVDDYSGKDLPVFTADQIAENNGDDGKPVWMSYGGHVYDVTDFIKNHPGGHEKILMAAGSAIEPYWHIYRQHFASDLPTRLLEHFLIGRLSEADQAAVDEQMEVIYETEKDPFDDEPLRHHQLKVHSDQPMNAEVPEHLLTQNYLTPNSIFYMRHHHPVPYLSKEQIDNYKLEIDLTAYKKDFDGKTPGKMKLSLDDLKSLPKVEIVATLQCSGNRRSGFNVFERTSGTTWGQGAISTAKWGGVRLSDILKNAGIGDPIEAQTKGGMEHVRFYAVDGMSVSIGIEKAMNPYGDVMVCYEMNDEELPRDHGYPLRLIVPGYAGIRNVKWLKKIELSNEEAEGPWQRGTFGEGNKLWSGNDVMLCLVVSRYSDSHTYFCFHQNACFVNKTGLNYKVLPPSVNDANLVDM
jgi:DMSO/TMAO reductase YedYZ molybdopterin-dependent catalytic subunit/predicted heme/steroid binding protein